MSLIFHRIPGKAQRLILFRRNDVDDKILIGNVNHLILKKLLQLLRVQLSILICVEIDDFYF